MKRTLALISITAVLAACGKQEAAPPAPAPAPAPAATAPAPAPVPAPEPTASAPAAPAAATASAELPAECQAYLDKVSACIAKQSGPAADAMKTSVEQAKASWAAYGGDKSQISAACKTSNDAFAAQAAAMKC